MNAPLLTAFLACPALIAQAPVLERQVLAMGTRFSLRVEGPSGAAEALLAEVARIEAACSTWRGDSAWSRLNGARGEAVALDPEWLRLLGRVQAWSRETEGAFDPVLLALIRAWGLREGGRTPTSTVLAQARAASGSSLLRLDAGSGTARLLHPQAGIEEGGFLKGYTLDAARRAALDAGAPSGLLDFGGQLLAWGRPCEVEVAHPRERQRPILRLGLKEASLSTSGCAERGRHILDPRSGEPCADWGAVSVVAGSALDADVLSTALYVLGPSRGFAWAEARGTAALFLPHEGAPRMTAAFQRLNPTFLVKEQQ